MNNQKELKQRNKYLEKLITFKDKEPIKVVTGIRRCGKSSLLNLMQQHLLNNGVEKIQIIAINFESFQFQEMNHKELYEYVSSRINKEKKAYLFFDELQRVKRWENTINSLRVDYDTDIYITGSNSYLLSSEYATYLAGRYVEIKMYPLSFKEFIDFNDYRIEEYKTLIGENKKRAYDKNGNKVEIRELFNAYLLYGGMPGIREFGFDQNAAFTILEGIYSSVIIRDILERGKNNDLRRVTDVELLKKITLFLADNIGNNVSLNTISNTLVTENLIQNEKKLGKPATKTVSSYVSALKEAFMFYEIKRFDIKGKEYLKTLGKYYIADIGLRNYLLGKRDRDRGHILENIVYFELLRRGFDVAIGKIDDLEVDFIATNIDEKIYIQVTESLESETTRTRELKPLMKINDNYNKIIITLNKAIDNNYEGIVVVELIDWLLEE